MTLSQWRTGNAAERLRHTMGWVLLAGVPGVLGATAIALAFRDDLSGECLRRQFVNCFVSGFPFALVLLLGAAAFVLSSRLGANPVGSVGSRPGRFVVYTAICAAAGMFLLQTCVLHHAWFQWSLAKRLQVMGSNLGTVALISLVFQVVLPFRTADTAYRGGKIMLAIALGFWGYMIASLFRMLPLFYGVE